MSKLPRPTTPDERLELKAATRRAMSLTKANAFALVTRVETAALSKYQAPQEDAQFMPIDIAVDLCRDVGAPIIVEEMARLLGFKLVPLEPGEGGSVGYDDIADLSAKGSDVVRALAEGMADGKLDHNERREARQRITEKIAVLHRVDQKLAGRAA